MLAYRLVIATLFLLSNGQGQASTLVPIGSGFNSPLGISADHNGNVFVADQANNAVKEILAAGGYSVVNTIGSGFNAPTAVAVDGSGNVFVADRGNSAIKEVLAAGGYSTVNTLASGLDNIVGIAIDASDNVFVVDWLSTVKELLAADNYATINTLQLGPLGGPGGLAVDASGNVFLSFNNKTVREFVAAGGFATTRDFLNLGLQIQNSAFGAIAFDDAGNLFAAQYQFNGMGLTNGDFVLNLLSATNFANYEIVYTSTPDVPSGIAVSNGAIFFSGLPANTVAMIAPVPTSVSLQEFGVD